jgi:hypothetical protein
VRYWVMVVSMVTNIVVVTGTVLVIGTAQEIELVEELVHESDWASPSSLQEWWCWPW